MATNAIPQAQLPPAMATIVDAEFREMPGLCLTTAQAQRLGTCPRKSAGRCWNT